MKNLYLLLILFFSLNSYSQTNEFQHIGKSLDGKQDYFYKIDKYNQEDNTYEIWLKTNIPDVKVKTKKGWVNKKQGYYLSYIVLHCNTQLCDHLDRFEYDLLGKVVFQDDEMLYNQKIVPNSVTSIIFNLTCTN